MLTFIGKQILFLLYLFSEIKKELVVCKQQSLFY